MGVVTRVKKKYILMKNGKEYRVFELELIIPFIYRIDETKIYLINWKIAEGQ